MRRQSKPFVTEYRASGRRSKESATTPAQRDGSRESEGSSLSFQAMGRSLDAGDDDSYDAVLRAADALFSSGPGASTAPPSAKPTGPVATPAAAAVFAAPVPPHPEAALTQGKAPTSVGRILRAIEDPISDPFAQREAEFAPKRRGRKPGSKNKPKPAPVTLAERAEPAVAAASRAALDPGVSWAARVATVAPQAGRPTSHRPIAAPGVAARQTREPFGWVRTKLRPGERWKRRLPKVAW